MLPRFFCTEALDPGASLDLPDAVAHHAVRVLRMQEGDRLRLFDGRGGEWTVRLTRLKPKPHVMLEAFDERDAESALAVKLIQSLPTGDKMDWVIQKCVELGVAAVQPVTARRSVIRLNGDKAARRALHWQGVAVAACEQCGRNRVPAVAGLLDLPQYLAHPAQENELRLVLAPGAELRLRDLPAPGGPVTLLVGPEGGLEEGEMQSARQAGFVPLGLGPRVLRTETAGPSALAAMMSLWGDL
ncbi:MAG: 16S rRNA (uracil(1498)-N(3))-methyltransferase [Rhodocyclaceae bacterium]|jgi:16S rRNA (uracil1498-N3)-methyltransferase|nr:16S rRNA (uracil(1498)-N(3))-methyltransferase [Rhodocyclaceae bacterium]